VFNLKGTGGTLFANAFAINAMLAIPTHVTTTEASEKMITGTNHMADGLEEANEKNCR